MAAQREIRGRFDVRALLRPEAWPHPVDRLELAETHVSWVVLTGAFAYKIKKPVRFDFLDATTLAARRQLCEEELRLNRRLAAELYLGVMPIVLGTDGVLRVGGKGRVLEYAVRMRQFDRRDEARALLARDAAGPLEFADLGARLAAFHATVPLAGAGSEFGTPGQVGRVLKANLATLRDLLREAPPEWRKSCDEAAEWLRAEHAELRAVIGTRSRAGRVRECHGDLHLGNIVRSGGRLLPFDALEFDPALRWIDVAAELAFLHMDLVAQGRADLAAAVLDAWLSGCGDCGALRVLRLYEVHLALVRAKVAALAQREGGGTPIEEARRRLHDRLQAAQALCRPQRPLLVLMHGPSGAGKSWLAERLVPALGAVRVRSDLERKRLVAPQARHAPHGVREAGLYSAAMNEATYARLNEWATAALAGRWSLILDATFLEAGRRDACRSLAERLAADLLLVDCVADRATLRARVVQRAVVGKDVSDADAAVLEAQLESGTALRADELQNTVRIDTRDADAVEHVRRRALALQAAA